jgi:hypothetical protein
MPHWCDRSHLLAAKEFEDRIEWRSQSATPELKRVRQAAIANYFTTK